MAGQLLGSSRRLILDARRNRTCTCTDVLSQDESGRNGIFEIAFEITWVTTSARTVFFLLYFW
jgi:hypothetical protein